MKPEVYILMLANGQYYVGSTIDIDRRIIEHQSGRTKSIKYKLPCKLIFRYSFGTYTAARRAETFIKKQKSKKFIGKITQGKINLNDIFMGR